MSQNAINELIRTLRSEIEAYGKLFRLLERQRVALLNRDPEEILSVSETVQAHTGTIEGLLRQRLGQMRAIDPALPATPRFSEFLESLDDPARPLVEELVREISRLVEDSDRHLRRNQMLYRRASDIGQDMLRALNPHRGGTDTYKRNGRARSGASATLLRGYVAKTA